MPSTIKLMNNVPETTFTGVGVTLALTGQLNKTITITGNAAEFPIAAGTDGLVAEDLQAALQRLASRVEVLEP